MTRTVAGIEIPDSAMAREVTELVRDAADDLLFGHSLRSYLWGMLHGRHRGLAPDPEMLYAAAMFHDLGLTPRYRRVDQRFELDGADAARDFLVDHGCSHAAARTVWLAVALHTTPEIPDRLEPEVALLIAGVSTDVVGAGADALTPEEIAEVCAAQPRTNFADGILHAFHAGMKDRPQTTFGTMNVDVLAHFDPEFTRVDLVDLVVKNPLPQ
ncbi:HD domain-containing protein [Mycolicibacterium litorale]|uniref:Metal-dependent phosphohydrolase n=1 Tax=Mycolicibacterium litorale TaxID=758802 RepID=A0AAD1IK13_9MYCO|nr:HD domain-containing protein [Mycolicibacterium litorale]MCV7415969.1 HD domain-containing protein [Mycolicibacterium litorale]TDY09222.1 metal dependent phosphohydrolase [Mycolicibacterium litorale]BBY17162.1 putative metal-dependent phosphohydrolase [Mycolicibacterium litorale]